MSLQRNDVRDKFLFNLDIYYVIGYILLYYLRVLILRLSTIVKEIYIYLVISQTVLLSLLLYNLIFIHFFFF